VLTTRQDDLSVEDFRHGLRKWDSDIPKEPEKWAFGGLKRTADGSFLDADLVSILQGATESVAGRLSTQDPSC
jgi:linoleate 10R-lipoxygenase